MFYALVVIEIMNVKYLMKRILTMESLEKTTVLFFNNSMQLKSLWI